MWWVWIIKSCTTDYHQCVQINLEKKYIVFTIFLRDIYHNNKREPSHSITWSNSFYSKFNATAWTYPSFIKRSIGMEGLANTSYRNKASVTNWGADLIVLDFTIVAELIIIILLIISNGLAAPGYADCWLSKHLCLAGQRQSDKIHWYQSWHIQTMSL